MDRSADALRRKFQALTVAVKPWRDMVSAGKQFPRHQSQTKAIAALLDGLQARIESDLKTVGAQKPGETTLSIQEIENRILAAYQIWSVYRTKFAQRLEVDLERFLKAADELAWLCYEPAREAALGSKDPRCKEPPLVYFTGEAIPFIDPRTTRFDPDGVPRQLLLAYQWPEAVTRLPFAVVGLPWYQTGFLPGALVIAHEVGHAVAEDFALVGALQALMKSKLKKAPARSPYWPLWTHELFADLWGCLSLGPAFGWALAEFLEPLHAANPGVNLAGDYPPTALRIYWNGRVLAKLGFTAEADALWTPWKKAAGGFDEGFLKDAASIAAAWLAAPYKGLGNRKLTDVLTFDSKQEEAAEAQAMSARAGKADGHADVRVLWAAVQKAFTPSATDRLLGRILTSASNKPRKKLTEVDQLAREAYVKQAGGLLL